MHVLHKVLVVVLIPLILLAGYQFATIQSTFDLIQDTRANIFLNSAVEVKYASDTLFMTGLINSALFEVQSRHEAGDSQGVTETVRRYREIQQQRYFSLQKLKESVSGHDQNEFHFIQILDENRIGQVRSIEAKIAVIDALNEEIVMGILTSKNPEVTEGVNPLIIESNQRTRELSEELAIFTNDRYIKIDEANDLVEESENRAQNTLNMIVLLGYFLSGIIVIFVYYLIIRPLQNFTRAIELKSMNGVEWHSLEPIRNDEIGIIYRFLNNVLGTKKEKSPTRTSTSKKALPLPLPANRKKRSRRKKN